MENSILTRRGAALSLLVLSIALVGQSCTASYSDDSNGLTPDVQVDTTQGVTAPVEAGGTETVTEVSVTETEDNDSEAVVEIELEDGDGTASTSLIIE